MSEVKVSEMEKETKKMEEQLEQIRKFKEMESGKQKVMQSSAEGTKWRSATQNQKIHGYEKSLVTHIEAKKGIPPRIQTKQAQKPS